MRHNYSQTQAPSETDRFEAIQDARAQATGLFWSAYYGGKWSHIWSKLTHRDNHLHTLTQETGQSPVLARHYSGIKSVPLDRINCSEGRSKDFDAEFRPVSAHDKDRWVGLAAAWEMGKPLPPIDLVQVGDTYCVRDGHHRLSVARVFGQQEIDAEVTIWESAANGAA